MAGIAGTQKLLVASDDADLLAWTDLCLRWGGFDVFVAGDSLEAACLATEGCFDLAIIDLTMRGLAGQKLVRELRARLSTGLIPVIVLTHRRLPIHKIIWLVDYTDDYVTMPFDAAELVARVRSALRRTKEWREISPTTGLPGNGRILCEVDRWGRLGIEFAVCHVDIDRFKSVVDKYGVFRAGEFIQALDNALRVAAASVGAPRPFIGHVGGDDFVVICAPEQVRPLTERTVIEFESATDRLYEPEDASRGYVELTRHRGDVMRANLVTLSIGVALSAHFNEFSSRAILEAASAMEHVAKTQRGSYVAVDRRGPAK